MQPTVHGRKIITAIRAASAHRAPTSSPRLLRKLPQG
jgi:hypothetical protein